MPQVVQARCPSCKQVLRIPAEWLYQAMRCKHCRQTFQAKSPATAPSAGPARTLVAAGFAPPPGQSAFASGFRDAPLPPGVQPLRRHGRGNWKGLLFGVCLLGGMAAGLVLAGPTLLEQLG